MRRVDNTGSPLNPAMSLGSGTSAAVVELSRVPGSLNQGSAAAGSPQQNAKFRGIRDLEENQAANADKNATRRKEGLLWALSRPGGHVDPRAALNKQGWHKFWIVLDQGKLSEYSNWKQKLDLHMDPIDLRLASVRGARDAERRFCFEVITPQFKRVYQATSEEDMNSWIMAINNALQSAVEGRSSSQIKPPPLTPVNDTTFRRDIGSVLTGKSSSVGHASHHHHHLTQISGSIPLRRTTVGARPATSRSTSLDENPDRLLQMLRENDQGNHFCADCGSKNKVEWVSINLAAIVCIECSGIHRSLGTHISKIRSLTLDTTSFTPDIIELLLLVGNRVSNMVFEARLGTNEAPPGIVKPSPQATREQRLKFITAKYVDKVFVELISATLSPFGTPEETLLAGIKKNEIQQIIYALALGANPNATDRSRGTHAIFLALAAADPAAPAAIAPATPSGTINSSVASLSALSFSSLSTAVTMGSSSSTVVAPATPNRVPFPAAELLVQNGAEIPATMPAFPLSPAALAYIEAKRGRLNRAGTDVPSSYDGVSLPPTLPAPNGATGLGFASSLAPSGEGVSPSASKWEASRLQKRLSAGGRLAKSPIPER